MNALTASETEAILMLCLMASFAGGDKPPTAQGDHRHARRPVRVVRQPVE